MPTRTFIEAVREGLRDEMQRDEAVIVLGEDVGKKGGCSWPRTDSMKSSVRTA